MVALLISGVTLHYQFFHRSDVFRAVVVDSVEEPAGGRSAHVIVANYGTNCEVLCNARWIYSSTQDFKNLVCVSGMGVPPVILQSGEKTVIVVKDDAKPLEVIAALEWEHFDSEQAVISRLKEKGKIPYGLYYGLLFEVVDRTGRVRETHCSVSGWTFNPDLPWLWPRFIHNKTVDLLEPEFSPKGQVLRNALSR